MRKHDFGNLKNTAENWQMEYFTFEFPLKAARHGTYASLDFSKYGIKMFSRDGLNYLMYRLKGFVDNDKVRQLYYDPLFKEDFVPYINQCRALQTSAELWRRGQTLIAAYNNSSIYGLLTNYNPKSNSQVLADIEKAGLHTDLTWWTLTPKAMNVYFEYKQVDGFEYGLNIRNGETGHTTLGYHLYVANDDYVFSTPLGGRRRHLSKLHLLDDAMQDVYGEIVDIKYLEFLQNNNSKKYAELLTDEKFDKLDIQAFNSLLPTLYTLVVYLHSMRKKKGYKTVATQALDILNKEIMVCLI